MSISTIRWVNGNARIIDQTKLPFKLVYLDCKDTKTLWHAIKVLKVRGAPALGVAAAFGILLGLKEFRGQDKKKFVSHVDNVCGYIGSSRPTAVNLFNALTQMKQVLASNPRAKVSRLKALLKKEAMAIFNEDRRVCRAMGANGAELIKQGQTALTICNAGALATADYGTALGVFTSAKKAKKRFRVFACETRPLLQGARLTAWELVRQGIDTTLICDSMAASLMKQGRIDAVFTGADRIAANGDAANKIGTYNLAVLARYHRVPFYVVAPYTTFDMKIKSGKQIPIEQRDREEVLGFGKVRTAPRNVKVYNPAFDVTDNRLITAIVTEYGLIKPVNAANIKNFFNRHAWTNR